MSGSNAPQSGDVNMFLLPPPRYPKPSVLFSTNFIKVVKVSGIVDIHFSRYPIPLDLERNTLFPIFCHLDLEVIFFEQIYTWLCFLYCSDLDLLIRVDPPSSGQINPICHPTRLTRSRTASLCESEKMTRPRPGGLASQPVWPTHSIELTSLHLHKYIIYIQHKSFQYPYLKIKWSIICL